MGYYKYIVCLNALFLSACSHSALDKHYEGTTTNDKIAYTVVSEDIDISSTENFQPLLDETILEFTSIEKINPLLDTNLLGDGTVVSGQLFKGVGSAFGCTSSIVGPKVIITAAHCVDGGNTPAIEKNVSMVMAGNPNTYLFTCMMHNTYRNAQYAGKNPRSSHDVALCYLNNQARMPFSVPNYFEVIDRETRPNINDDILMTGYGCTEVGAKKFYDRFENRMRYIGYTTGVSDGLFRVGMAQISETNEILQTDKSYQARIEAHSLTGERKAKLCSGDSGGPVFKNVSIGNIAEKNNMRRIIGINSAVGSYASDTLPVKIVSTITDLNDVSMNIFFENFIKRHPDAKICGVNLKAGTNGCRR